MGQYYVVVFLKGSAKKGWEIRAWASPHNHGSRATLCEHYNRGSDSEFVQVIERQLTPSGKHWKTPVVWAGDYADAEDAQVKFVGDEEPLKE